VHRLTAFPGRLTAGVANFFITLRIGALDRREVPDSRL